MSALPTITARLNALFRVVLDAVDRAVDGDIERVLTVWQPSCVGGALRPVLLASRRLAKFDRRCGHQAPVSARRAASSFGTAAHAASLAVKI
jgi:hypothetical protein